MRKYHQGQVLELIKTLEEAHRELVRLHSEQETGMFVGLLADCQECAVHIGNYIEGLEGEGTSTVSKLEEYCELLYFASIEANNGGNLEDFFLQLQNQLVRIEDSVHAELRQNKIEIAFFPYKASMWDSCESVWKAAIEDPQCDAYVVPIPYFDRKQDGTLGQMNYEGDQYPDYVPVVDWREYSLEERRPDIIVTINPYDDRNLVTVVHPDYFSRRLKGYTDLLVYIPYFVSVDDVAEHFCTSSGVLLADRVIVQSDRIRETYIRTLKQFERENQCVGRFGNVEDKIVALGSPKFDKVIRTKREDCYVPDAWRQLIEKPDGTRKKVILYNTTISALLDGNEKVLDKLRYVFENFRKRDDVVLLWRPHPLNESTYRSMRPQLLVDYERIVEQYKCERIGIYDDTADLHRAIAISDAYYGDWGSLVALYSCTGKPVMIQDLSVLSSPKEQLLPHNVHDDGQYLWFSVRDINGVFRANKETMTAEYMAGLNEAHHDHLFYDVIEAEGKLYFAPLNSDNIVAYDMALNTIEKQALQIRERPEWLNPITRGHFRKVIQYKRQLFFVANTYPAILRYDLESREMTYYSDWLGHLESTAKKSSNYQKWNETVDFDCIFVAGKSNVGSEIVLNVVMSNELMFFDMETFTHQFFEIGRADERYWGVCYDGRHYWLASRTGHYVVKWERESQTYERIELPDYVKTGQFHNFQALVYADGYVWMLPFLASTALKIDIQDHSIQQANEFISSTRQDPYLNATQREDAIYALTLTGIHQWKIGAEQGDFFSFDVPDQGPDEFKRLKSTKLQRHPAEWNSVIDAFYWDVHTDLNLYLDYVQQLDGVPFAKPQSDRQMQLCSALSNNLNGASGQAILEYCKRSIHIAAGGVR
ncbi:hypothetical protein [Cohnella lubricantis]|uniref:CDP-Glycerol:Poly(Glycerophosphate) glycerophosphotransferase n=1 Tax=Cohnella lubricantis TaxID=2163172 RepID=A0A841TDT7_9BACL|nr:hypothetical protein [Cohnella lubricantis]MBB6677400.1 hypothetical protein [Cohnella lubricantis]MBP2118709.1 hypothetical protein [Cohnella lubricantis]